MHLYHSTSTAQADSWMKNMPGELMHTGHWSTGHSSELANSSRDSAFAISDHGYSSRFIAQDMPPHVIGVELADVRIVDGSKTNTNDNYYVLGVILLDSLDIIVEELRKTMCAQIELLPTAFCILTKQGWPLSRHQEARVHITHVLSEASTVMIRKHFEHPPVGIITTLGECLGFLFIDPKWNIHQLRDAINEQLMVEKKKNSEYRFLERNGWPVGTNQETILSVLDILRIGHNVCIQYGEARLCPPPGQDEKRIPTKTPTKLPQSIRVKPKGIAIKTSLKKKREPLVAKPILLSYVRAEAAAHALNLKEGLVKLGFSVYLDVHEIKTGSDWQDALNYAVSNCQFFVPLITPMYGKTQWTNREVKLADVLGKSIIPISFLDQWPPECLAIQFASTQYIPWKPQEGDNARPVSEPKSSDLRVWEQVYVKRVCKELSERCKTTKKKAADNEKSHESQIPGSYAGGVLASNFLRNNENHLVVISGHPKQKILIHQIRVTLESDGYDVWCSSDIQDYQDPIAVDDSVPPSASNTPRELTSIPEGFSVFGQTYQEIASTIADSKRGSALGKDSEDRRPLTRMISQVSDISQVSSLTPDKMERLRTFQQKTDQAGVVIIIVSEAYTKSKTSQQQVFYCEHRKHVVLVKFDQSSLPSWFTMLMGNDMITNIQSAQFINTLKSQVKRAMNPSSSETPKDATAEAKIQCLVNFMQKSVPQPETCIYIAGSSKLQYSRSEQIARAIGKELARIQNITLCTGGFFGAQEIVAKTFHEAVENNKDVADFDANERVVHLLPFKDTKDFTSKAHQNPDGSFEAMPYGKTCFAGDSVKERETAVARLFDTCIVIEGGPGAAHEVEEFIWNDHFVIPIISTGGAAGGQYGVPLKIFEAPPCVSECDWSILSEKEAKPENVAEAVINIVVALKQSIVTHINSQVPQPTEGTKTKYKMRTRSRKSKILRDQDPNKPLLVLKKDETVQTQTDESNYYSHGHRLLQRQVASYSVADGKYKYTSRWQRFLRLFSATKVR